MKKLGNEGVSEVIGTVLLLAIAISAFSVVAVYVFSNTGTTSSPHVNLVGYMDQNYDAIIENKGGDSVKLENIRVIIWKGDERSSDFSFTKSMLQSYNSTIYLKNNSRFFDFSNNDRWDVGDYIKINCTDLFGDVANWQISVVVIDKQSNSIIMSGILQNGILHKVPPIARFTYAPWNPKTQELLFFNASQSYDPDGGEIVSYAWNFGDNTTGSGKEIWHRYSSSGTYNVTLTITDDDGQTNFTTKATGVPEHVHVVDNQPPVAYFTNISEGNGWIYFDASQSYDPDGTIIKYIWNFDDGTPSVEVSTPTIRHQYQYSGTYNVTLIVVDNEVNNPGTNSTSSMVLYGKKLTVPNILPIPAFFYTPGDPSTSTYVFFNATDSYDRDGNIVNYSWDFNDDGNPDAYGVTPEGYLFSHSGYYNVTLTVTDNLNGSNSTTKQVYIRSPSGFRTFLLVDNTPHDRGFDGISNIIASLNIGDYDWAKAIDQDNFYTFHNSTGWHNNSVPILSTLLDEYDIVIWSTGDFPGDGNSDPYGANSWSTPMTEGVDDASDHVHELAQHLQHNGTLLLCGAYAVRDLQEYGGNGVSQSEVDLGKNLGLYYRDDSPLPWPYDTWDNAPDGYDDNNGGINETLHSGQIGYYTDGAEFKYGPIYANGTINGVPGASSDGANIIINQDIPLYSLIKQNDPLFNYSLIATGGGTPINEGFEGGSFPPPGWVVRNVDGGETWELQQDSWWHHYAHTGSYCARCYKGGNDWLITPQIIVPENGIFEFWAKSDTSPKAKIEVRLSTTGNTASDLENGTFLGWDTAVPTQYTHYSYDISNWAGQKVYIGIKSFRPPADKARVFVDDVRVRGSGIPTGNYAIDATRGANRSIVLGFDLNSPYIDELSREQYLRNVINWLAEGAGYETKVYVDNDRPLTWYDDAHVHTIQEGINRVSIGGTVYVYNGTDYAPALINKSINLVGIGNPVISSNSEYGLKITVDWVYISNFTIQNIGSLQNGIYLDGSACTTIVNCNVSNAQKGIYLQNSPHSTIQDSIIYGNDYGIYLKQSLGNTIENNNISSGGNGIYIESSHSNKIQDNDIYSNSGDGIDILTSENNIVRGNNIYSNSGNGIYLYSSTNENQIFDNTIYNNKNGVYLQFSNRNVIGDNDVFNNSEDGISIEKSSGENIVDTNFITHNNDNGVNIQNSTSNELVDNHVYLNGLNAINIYYSSSNTIHFNTINMSDNKGIYLYSSNANNISSNYIFNDSYGIYMVSSASNIIRDNIIYNNSQTGVYLEESLSSSAGDNEIINNTIYSNGRKGISLSSSDKNVIIDNSIYSNIEEGIFLSSHSNSNEIQNNTVYTNSFGICLTRGNYNDVVNNTVYSNTFDAIYINLYSSENIIANNTLYKNLNGITLDLSNVNTISNNIIWDNNRYGIYLYKSNQNTINSNPNISSNLITGILMDSSDGNSIYSNIIYNNTNGIHLIASGGSGNTITNNTIYLNSQYGIYLENSKASTAGSNEIIQNEIYSNGNDGIYLSSSNTNSIQQNEIYENNYAITVYSSTINSIQQNEIYENNYAIFLNLSDDNTIDSNIIYNNTEYGLYLYSSNGNRIGNNSISYNVAGIYLYSSSEGDQYKISGNQIWNNTIGVYLNSSDSNYFGYSISNTIWNNTYGVYIISSSNNHFNNNIISNNSYGISLYSSSNIEMNGNGINNNTIGVCINESSSDNTITENTFYLNSPSQYGVYIVGALCKNNKIFSNNFINITAISRSLGYDSGGGNSWYNIDSEDKEGNYWENYAQIYPNASQLPQNNSWYWSIPYDIDGNANEEDIHPLIAKTS